MNNDWMQGKHRNPPIFTSAIVQEYVRTLSENSARMLALRDTDAAVPILPSSTPECMQCF